MKILSNSKHEELLRDAQRERDVKKVEKALQRELEKERQAAAERLDDLKYEHSKTIKELQRKLDRAENEVDDQIEENNDTWSDKLEEVREAHEKETNKLKARIADLDEELKAIKENAVKNHELARKEEAIKDREDDLTRAADFLKTREEEFEKKVKAFEQEMADKKSDEYKKGYADGTVDAVRAGATETSKLINRMMDTADKAIVAPAKVIEPTIHVLGQSQPKQKN